MQIAVKMLTAAEWSMVVDALAEQAIFAANLLAGEMPQDVETAFQAAHVSLFPTRRDDLNTDCSCPDYANPCKHVAAVYYLLGERFDEDPFLIFQLRGKDKEQLLAELRLRRTAGEVALAEESPFYIEFSAIQIRRPHRQTTAGRRIVFVLRCYATSKPSSTLPRRVFQL